MIRVSREHTKFKYDNHGNYTFKYRSITPKYKYEIKGSVHTEHAKKRIKEIFKAVHEKIAEKKNLTSKKLEKTIQKVLHHKKDLKDFAAKITKRHH